MQIYHHLLTKRIAPILKCTRYLKALVEIDAPDYNNRQNSVTLSLKVRDVLSSRIGIGEIVKDRG